MALLPWVYNNPRINYNKSEINFTFANKNITIRQNLDMDISVDQNTAYKLWDGSFLIAKYLENELVFPQKFWSNKKCVELGAGCGLVGIVAWMHDAVVTFTDLSDVLDHTRTCVDYVMRQMKMGYEDWYEQTRQRVSFHAYKWGDQLPNNLQDLDFVFGSDIIYQASSIDDLVNSIQQFKSNSDCKILISYKHRGLGEDVFFEKLKLRGINFFIIPERLHPKEFMNSMYQLIEI